MNKEKLKALINQFQNHTISDQDLYLLKHYLKNNPSDEFLLEIVDELGADSQEIEISSSDQIFQNILSNKEVQQVIAPQKNTKHRLVYWLSAAAACLLFFSTIGFYFMKNQSSQELADLSLSKTEIIPGGSKAKVVLDDGTIIDLETLKNDTVIYLDGYAIQKDIDGVLSYQLDPQLKDQQIVYNTIITPKAGEYHLVLPDGTKIWVNSSSELKYPLNFDKESREVELKGEAYFDVSKIQSQQHHVPFIVNTGSQKLEVLGTIFNIQSKNNKIRTTLVEGSVRLTYADGKKFVLKPNQQAIYEEQKNNIDIIAIDPFYITAWKNGSFAFDNASIHEVMDILSAWYDVEIDYLSKVDDIHFTGTVSKYEQIDKVLDAIEMTGSIRFKIDGRRILVMK
ncbi:FecR family protein [Sphingobacterium hungaricum]|uniref:FecR family protein n=1 Tax=Sphingobacterium hungaricum TaxID=2082723 RepID=A0A928YR68_9SPHI|nr:FecR family protein [Sphingobacterium hungaricum]MBE8714342.1 hypothetical protein [Sphingobacterium hungaricum]